MASLAAENAALKDKLSRLERLISRNSGNSSMAPSGDDQPGRTPPKDKKPRGTRKRKPGKQSGAPGAHLAWNDDPDDTLPPFPAGASACGADLAGGQDLGVRYSHQVTDLPADIRARRAA